MAVWLSPKQERGIAEAKARLNIWHGAIGSEKTIASLFRWPQPLAEARLPRPGRRARPAVLGLPPRQQPRLRPGVQPFALIVDQASSPDEDGGWSMPAPAVWAEQIGARGVWVTGQTVEIVEPHLCPRR
ncbi:hypothetical protein [Nonomuraea sp. NPDC049141]|uniref:hypothetical protein n=1 Tax=Nonomuraea sp. NPDC049141 TaxID=3155500 RepID=UPI0033E83184